MTIERDTDTSQGTNVSASERRTAQAKVDKCGIEVYGREDYAKRVVERKAAQAKKMEEEDRLDDDFLAAAQQ